MNNQEKKEYIDILYNSDKFLDCLHECFKLTKETEKTVFNYDTLFYAFYRIGIIYSILGEYKLSFKYIKKSKLYAETSQDFILVNWNYSYYYFNINDYENALIYIDKAIHECLVIECEHLLYGALVHKALLTEDENLMIDSINNLKKFKLKQERMDYYYADLLSLYIKKNNIVMAKRILDVIETPKIKNELSLKIYGCINNL